MGAAGLQMCNQMTIFEMALFLQRVNFGSPDPLHPLELVLGGGSPRALLSARCSAAAALLLAGHARRLTGRGALLLCGAAPGLTTIGC